MTDTREIAAALAAPFEPREVKWKPAVVRNNRCLAMAYIDARLVQDRLDEVLGLDGWQTEYFQIGSDSIECRLTVRINGEWITRADVGSISDQPDAGDQLKAAYSDALKRAAVAFGIGRYLYRLPSQWVDYDPVKKQIVSVPQLPTLGSLGITRPSSRPSAKQVLKMSTCPDQSETKLPASGDHIQVWIDDARERIKAAGTLAELLVVWNSLTPEIQGHVVGDKERRKGELVAEQSAPAN